MKELHTCDICGAALPPEQLYHFDGQDLRTQCLENQTLFCRYCGEQIWMSDNAGTTDTPLCQSCFDDHYTNCCRCGSLIRESAAYDEEGTNMTSGPTAWTASTAYPGTSPSTITTTSRSPSSTERGPGFSVWSWSWTRAARTRTTPGTCWASPTPTTP